MKYLLIFLFIPFIGTSQGYPELYYEGNIDSTNTVCKERGHTSKGWATTTLAYCDPITTDTECHTEIWVDWCNTTSYECSRCNKSVSENGSRYFTWKSDLCKHKGTEFKID